MSILIEFAWKLLSEYGVIFPLIWLVVTLIILKTDFPEIKSKLLRNQRYLIFTFLMLGLFIGSSLPLSSIIKDDWKTNENIRKLYWNLDKNWRKCFDIKSKNIKEINVFSKKGNEDLRAEIIKKRLKDVNISKIFGINTPEPKDQIPKHILVKYFNSEDEKLAETLALFIKFTTGNEAGISLIPSRNISKTFEIWMDTLKENEIKSEEDFHEIFQRALDCHKEKDWNCAIKNYNLAKKLQPENENVFFNLAIAHHNREKPGDFTLAIEYYTKTIDLVFKNENKNMNLASIYFNRGNAYFKRKAPGDKNRAITDYGEAICIVEIKKLNVPNLAAIYLNRGHAYVAIRAHEKAKKDYRKVCEISPNSNECTDAKRQLDWLEKKL